MVMSFDPKTNRVAREIAKERDKEEPELEARFPYPRVNFDPFFFGVTVLTPKAEGADE